MRVLILTHGRSGGQSLSRWIHKEFDYNIYHEPLYQKNYEEIKDNLIHEDNMVVKEFPFNLINKGYDLEEFASTFDKVILHKRNNLRDIAISTTFGWIRNKPFDNKISLWHETYEITEDWINENMQEILKEEQSILKRDNELYKIFDNPNFIGLRTTFENIFENKTDIPKLLEYLKIKNPYWIDVLDSRHKLRNGTIGTDNYISTKPNKSNIKLI